MDKLQPLLTHRFWILLGLAIVLSLVGWWMATGQLQAEYKANVAQWDSKWNLVRQKIDSTSANDKWVEAIRQANAEKDRQYHEQHRQLYQAQQELRAWPRNVVQAAEAFPPAERIDFSKLPYRGRLPARFTTIYRAEYLPELERLRNLVEPYTVWEQQVGAETRETRSGVVDLPFEVLPRSESIDPTSRALPTSDQVWDAQEDLWIIQSILQAIRQVNGGATSIDNASIRKVEEFMLMGGFQAPPGAGDSEGAAAPAAGRQPTPYRGIRRPQSSTSDSEESAAFEPAEEFGDPMSTAAMEAMQALIAAGKLSMGPDGTLPARRYVNDEPDLPYVTRGFYIRVIMDQRDVPTLASALANMPWQAQISRIQMAAYSPLVPGTDPVRAARRPVPPRGGTRGPLGPRPRTPGADPDLGRALSHPDLADVAIAGLITIYRPPATDSSAEGAAPGQQPPADTEQPPADAGQLPAGEVPATPGGTDLPGQTPVPQEPAAVDPAVGPPANENQPSETGPAPQAPVGSPSSSSETEPS